MILSRPLWDRPATSWEPHHCNPEVVHGLPSLDLLASILEALRGLPVCAGA